jgi:hypothetical protein
MRAHALPALALLLLAVAGGCKTRLLEWPVDLAASPTLPPPRCADPLVISGVGSAPPVTWVGVGDFDRDGNLDMAGVGQGVAVVYGNGDGTFATDPLPHIGTHDSGWSGAAADVNGDGNTDVIMGEPGHQVQKLLGRVRGSFSGTAISVGFMPDLAFVALGDVDGDRRPDVLALDRQAPGVTVVDALIQAADDTFGPPVPSPPMNALPFALALDVDGNGTAEVLVPLPGGEVKVLTWAAGSWRTIRTAVVFPQTVNALAAGDLDGDGKPDLAAVATVKDGDNVYTAVGDGAGSFSLRGARRAGEFPIALAVTDWNGDGRLDLAVANSNADHSASFLFGLGDGTVDLAQSCLAVTFDSLGGPLWVAAGDFDRDGRKDLAFAFVDGLDLVVNTTGR